MLFFTCFSIDSWRRTPHYNARAAHSHETRIDTKKLPSRRRSGDCPSGDGIPISGRPGGRWEKGRQENGMPVEQLWGLPEGVLPHNRWKRLRDVANASTVKQAPQGFQCLLEPRSRPYRRTRLRTDFSKWNPSGHVLEFPRREHKHGSEGGRIRRRGHPLSFDDSESEGKQPNQFHPHGRAGAFDRRHGHVSQAVP